jgi:hypothetical protein
MLKRRSFGEMEPGAALDQARSRWVAYEEFLKSFMPREEVTKLLASAKDAYFAAVARKATQDAMAWSWSFRRF